MLELVARSHRFLVSRLSTQGSFLLLHRAVVSHLAADTGAERISAAARFSDVSPYNWPGAAAAILKPKWPPAPPRR